MPVLRNSLIFAVIILLIFLLVLFFSIRKSKQEKIKKYKRKMLIKDLIKKDLLSSKGLKNIEVLNLTITLNKAKSKPKVENYICLFDFDHIKEKLNCDQLAVEVEGINNSSKKNANYTWSIIQELDLKQATFLTKLNNKKLIKNKYEKNQLKEFELQQNLNQIELLKEKKVTLEKQANQVDDQQQLNKFIPKRKKTK